MRDKKPQGAGQFSKNYPCTPPVTEANVGHAVCPVILSVFWIKNLAINEPKKDRGDSDELESPLQRKDVQIDAQSLYRQAGWKA